jgi:hypothetical protein
MDKIALEIICKKIYQQYPLIRDQKPTISKQGTDRYLLIFSHSGKAPDGMSIQQQIRVVATADGQILKTSMSR